MIREFLRQYRILLISLLVVLAGLHLVSSSIDDPKNAGFFGRLIFTAYEPIYKVVNYPFAKASAALSNITSITTIHQEKAKRQAGLKRSLLFYKRASQNPDRGEKNYR